MPGSSGRHQVVFLLLVLVSTGFLGASQLAPPVLESLKKSPKLRPVVFVPGVTGSELRERSTGRVVWGKGKNLLRPRDLGYGEARPVRPPTELAGPLEAGGVLLSLNITGLFSRQIFQPIVDLVESNGYQIGDLAAPSKDDTFFFFTYDWRQDNVVSASLLADRLEELRLARGDSQLDVDLICQSNGAYVCRYFSKYRGARLEEAEAGIVAESNVTISKLALVGTSNGGSLRVLRELNRGRQYIPLVGRFWSEEVLFTFLALFQDLPTFTQDLFLDTKGTRLNIDLFDASNWMKYGWSIYASEPQRRLAEDDHNGVFGTAEDRFALLESILDRSRRIHRLLRQDGPDLGSTRVYLVQNSSNSTPTRAVLSRQGTVWSTLFAGDEELEERPDLVPLITTPGDGHATLESQLWLSPQEMARLVSKPVDVEGKHFWMMLNPDLQMQLLQILAD